MVTSSRIVDNSNCFQVRNIPGLILLFWLLILTSEGKAQSPFTGLEPMFTEPKHYITHFTDQAPAIDGNIQDAAWQSAKWSEAFVDIEGDRQPKPALNTRMKMLWNDSCLFIAAEMQEPHVWANLKKRDEVVFYDNDFEVFIDPDNDTHQYFEVEVNALNTIFDLFMPKPYRNGGQANIPWHVDKLKSAVRVQGTLNNPADQDQGWTLEMAIPFRAISTGNQTKVPHEADFWRINFSRVEWDTEIKDGIYVKQKDQNGKTKPEHNWVWSPQGVINMHYPERWGYLYFTRKPASESAATHFTLPYAEKQKQHLWLLYYRQKEYFQKHQKYTPSLTTLGFKNNSTVLVDNQANTLTLEASRHQFMGYILGPDNKTWCINQDGFVHIIQNKK